ncbi:MAG: quinolinate synthase NadA [Candidatus Thermoplasmatota archaeon]|nr:quinolinate synthase NadA [Candidatus Thermoplasmatota archaeon]
MNDKLKKLDELKKKRNAVILAHNYQRPEVQDAADFTGDSLALAVRAKKTDADVIVFCGVDFMAQSAKILNPDKIVLHPDIGARCPMAAMVDAETLLSFKKEKGLDVVSYVNTTAEVKAVSDICCTSANAVKVVKSMPDGVIFVPDSNLGKYVKRYVKDKEVILWPGFCPTHEGIEKEDILRIKEIHPEAEIIAHPECTPEVIDIADKIASTEGMVNYAKESKTREFIVATERELCYRMKKEMPEKIFYSVENAVCPPMKKITLDKIINSLEKMEPEIAIDKETINKAKKPLEKMMELGR